MNDKEKLIHACRRLLMEIDDYLNDEGDRMKLEDTIHEVEKLVGFREVKHENKNDRDD